MVSETEKEEVESDAEKEEVQSDAEPLIVETVVKEKPAAAASAAEGKGRSTGRGKGGGRAVVKPNTKKSRKRQIDDLFLSEEEKAQRKVEEGKPEVEVEALARLLTEI